MTLADRTITALREQHDELAALVSTLTDTALVGPSGASEWTIAAVLSHLGSGAEITLASVRPALTGGPAPEGDVNQGVWDRWNIMTPREQADGFVSHDAALLDSIEALTPDQRDNLPIKLGFLPNPVGVVEVAGLRLNEVALHSWDARAGLDPAATLGNDAAAVLLEQLSGPLAFLLGFIGKADRLASRPVVVDLHGFGLVITDTVRLTPQVTDATATFAGPAEAAVRLLGGRLSPAHTPDGVHVDGNVSLDDLRTVFPGF